MPDRPPITNDTLIATLLRDYPEVEDVLITIAPVFKKLRNPALRRRVARVANLRQAAAVARIPSGALVNTLRAAVGQEPMDYVADAATYFEDQPEWFEAGRVIVVLRDDELDPNVMPINPLLRAAKDLGESEIAELVTSHLPAPAIDILHNKGYRTWTVEDADKIRTFVSKTPSS